MKNAFAGEEREDAAQLILEEQADENAGDERPEDADFLKHLADAEALGGRLGLRELLAEERDAVEHGRHEEQAELHLPADLHALAENPADEAAEHQAGRPARVENVQVVGAVVREERGDERVGHGFERAVGQGEDERARCTETCTPCPGPVPWSRANVMNADSTWNRNAATTSLP